MKNKPYDLLFRDVLGGHKFLPSGELNPNYNKKWGLAKGVLLSKAKSYSKDREIFIPESKTESPIEFIALGIATGKSQYQFKELEQELRDKGISDARRRAVDVSRMKQFLDDVKDMEAYVYSGIKEDKGIETQIAIENPNYYAQKYLKGEISREEFFDMVALYKQNSIEYINQAYGKL